MKKKKENISKKKEKKISNHQVETPTRRDFLKTAWKGLGIVAGLEFVGLTLHYLSDEKEGGNKNNIFTAGLIDEFPINSVTPFRQGHFYLVRFNDGGFMAFSLKCTHLGCSILWDDKKDKFFCPCHSSSFAINGDVINPPAPRALDMYKIKIIHGQVEVNLNKKIKRDSFDKSQISYG